MARTQDFDTHPNLIKKHVPRVIRDTTPQAIKRSHLAKRFDPALIAHARRLWNDGMYWKHMLHELGIGYGTLRNLARENNFPPRSTEGLRAQYGGIVVGTMYSRQHYDAAMKLSFIKRKPMQRIIRDLLAAELKRNNLI